MDLDGENVHDSRFKWIRIANLLAFLLMFTVNVLANVLPINGVTSGAVSDAYPNQFAPAGITFAIWGVIYLLQAAFVLFQFGVFGRHVTVQPAIVRAVSLPFVLYSILNAAWLFAWHNFQIPLSMVLMVLLLACLAYAYRRLEAFQPDMRLSDKIFVRLPFRITLGWITVAAVANAVVLLVYLDWSGWGIPQQIWLILVLMATLAIALAVILPNNDAAYGMVILWAYMGILLKHITVSGGDFDRQQPAVLLCLTVCLVALFTAIMLAIHRSRHRAGKLPEAGLLK